MIVRRPRIVPYGRGLPLTLLGVCFAFGALAYYQGLLIVTEQDPRGAGLIRDSGYAVVAILLVGLVLTFSGLNRVFRQPRSDSLLNSFPTLRFMSSVLRETSYSRIFAASSVAYGLAFAITSTTLVYQPGLAFSNAYGVNVPSAAEAICCGAFGQMPQLVLYLTQNFGLLLIPINLILMFTSSWLVGLNATVASYAYRNSPKVLGLRWIAGFGSIVGLFTACPTCASIFLLTIIGLTGALSIAATVASFQGLFIAIGMIVLVATPIISSHAMMSKPACALPNVKDESL